MATEVTIWVPLFVASWFKADRLRSSLFSAAFLILSLGLSTCPRVWIVLLFSIVEWLLVMLVMDLLQNVRETWMSSIAASLVACFGLFLIWEALRSAVNPSEGLFANLFVFLSHRCSSN